MHSKHKQRGITIGGLITWCIILGAAALIGMKLFPLYNEKMKVDFALKKVAEDTTVNNGGKADIVKAIMKQFEVSDMDRWNSAQELSKVLRVAKKRDSTKRQMSLDYEIRGPMCCGLDVVLNYAKYMELPASRY